MISEPGRFYVSNAFRLAANVIARRTKMTDNLSDAVPDETDQPSVMCMFSWVFSVRTLSLTFYLQQITSTMAYMGHSTAFCSTINLSTHTCFR